jgi:hypothetical protein
MNVDMLTEHHHEHHHRCVVHTSAAPNLVVHCIECGGPMLAALFSDCTGVDRRILMLRCSGDGSTGQLRFTRAVPCGLRSNVDFDVEAGQQGYVHGRCTCGNQGTVAVSDIEVADDLELRCICGGCGGAFDLQVPVGAGFAVKAHRHG